MRLQRRARLRHHPSPATPHQLDSPTADGDAGTRCVAGNVTGWRGRTCRLNTAGAPAIVTIGGTPALLTPFPVEQSGTGTQASHKAVEIAVSDPDAAKVRWQVTLRLPEWADEPDAELTATAFGRAPPATRSRTASTARPTERADRAVARVVAEISAERGIPMAQVALAWLLH